LRPGRFLRGQAGDEEPGKGESDNYLSRTHRAFEMPWIARAVFSNYVVLCFHHYSRAIAARRRELLCVPVLNSLRLLW
jgi:hypothetical protein